MQIQDFPYIEITIRAYDTRPKEENGGEGLATFIAFSTDVFDGEPSRELDENGTPINKIGYIGGGMGSVVIASRKEEPGFYFMIPHDDLWNAIQEALLDQKEKKGGEK